MKEPADKFKRIRPVIWFFLTPIMMLFHKAFGHEALGDWYERGELGLTQEELVEYRRERLEAYKARHKIDE